MASSPEITDLRNSNNRIFAHEDCGPFTRCGSDSPAGGATDGPDSKMSDVAFLSVSPKLEHLRLAARSQRTMEVVSMEKGVSYVSPTLLLCTVQVNRLRAPARTKFEWERQ